MEDKETKIVFEDKLLEQFARAMAPSIKSFYKSDEGRKYYEEWLKKHPEYQK